MTDFFGLDIGSHAIKVVELEKKGKTLKLKTLGTVNTPAGSPFSESDLDQKALANAIKQVIKEARISSRQVVTAFPESLIFSRVIEMPNMTDKELANAIQWEAEQYVPMPLNDVRLSHMVLKRGEKTEKMKVFLVAAPLSLIERYLNILKFAGLTPLAFETEIVAIKRSLINREESSPTTLLTSIGASTTDLCIVDEGKISFTRSIGTGGVALARAISQELGFDMTQAEEYKKAYGILEDQLEGKIMQTIKPVLDVIVSEVEKAILYYQTHSPTTAVKRIILTGGSAQLPGLIVYLAETLSLEVEVGNPWVNIEVPENLQKTAEELVNQASYAVAVGLAMRGV